MYVYHELSYDSFHSKADRIYRVYVKGQMMGSEMDMAVTASPMAAAMQSDYPEIEEATRVRKYGDWLIKYEDKKFHEQNVLFADSNFFRVFDFELLRGDKEKALASPRSMILTETIAKKYFGNEDPMGRMLRVESDTVLYEVTGLMKDVPSNSHIHFDMLGSLITFGSSRSTMWVSHNFYTYFLVQEGANVEKLGSQLNGMIDKYVGPQIEQFLGITMDKFAESGNSFGYFIQALRDIHLNPRPQYEYEPQANKIYIYIFSVIAFFILLVACVNFMNLATARSSNRAKEVGLRKVLGSGKGRLRLQFLLESIIITLISMTLAVALVQLFTPAFNDLIQTELSLDFLKNPLVIPILVGFAMLVGVFAGSYPAFVLSAFNPIKTLKGEMSRGAKSGVLRSVLVVFQFTVATFILMGTFVVYQQVRYIQEKDLGFKKDNLLIIRRSDGLRDRLETFKTEAKKLEGVVSVANAGTMPGKLFSNNAFFLEGKPSTNNYLLWEGFVSSEFTDVFDFELVEGRFFSKDVKSDSLSVVINEAAARLLEIDKLGATRLMKPSGENDFNYMNIVGIVKDFHFQSLHEEIQPMVFTNLTFNIEGYITVRLKQENMQDNIRELSNLWSQFAGDYPFDYYFFDDDYKKIYRTEQQTGSVFLVFSFLAIIIACLGLFGLVSYTASQRTREIGVRKALGSTSGEIISLISKETLRLTAFSLIIAVPLAYIAMRYWLQSFAYRVELNPMIFVLVVLLILSISLLTVVYQSVKAARQNPANSLRYE